jgi:hypothetical protein
MVFNETEVRAVLQFFNIPNASEDDMRLLLFMGFGSGHGLDLSKRVAAEAGWKCQVAIEAIEKFLIGRSHGRMDDITLASRASAVSPL